MPGLPITRMTLYKHGVGFFERKGKLDSSEIELTFRADEMKDILKSLTVIDWGDGHVSGIEYPTPQSVEERLAGCSIALDDLRSLRDLIVSLRGQTVELILDQEERMKGVLIGLDEVSDRQPMESCLVSILGEDGSKVSSIPIKRLHGVSLISQRGADDLRFYLQTAATSADYSLVKIHLSEGAHDLSVSYIAPAPTWRVSYRIVLAEGEAAGRKKAYLQGWGIFDNRLEEDLINIHLSLVAGMPISFIYDLYTPYTPERPVIEEDERVTPGPIAFQGMVMEDAVPYPAPAQPARMLRAAAPAPAGGVSAKSLEKSTQVEIENKDLGELFQYKLATPISVGRGQSAMAPIISTHLECEKYLIYNQHKLPEHPIATLRMKNTSGVTLERGPATIIDQGEYVGEAMLAFTRQGAELLAPYSVELGLTLREASEQRYEFYRLSITGAYLLIEEWDIQQRTITLVNQTEEEAMVLVEHPRQTVYTIFDSPKPKETTMDQYRFDLRAGAFGEEKLTLQERRLRSRREELQKQSYAGLQRYLRNGLMNEKLFAQVSELLRLWEQIGAHREKLAEANKQRETIYKAQEQIRANLGALEKQGKEGSLRAGFVTKLEEYEQALESIRQDEIRLLQDIKRLEGEIEKLLKSLDGKSGD